MDQPRIDDFRECPECDKPVMGPTALLSHLEFSHEIDDPIGYLLELRAPDEPRRWALRRRSRAEGRLRDATTVESSTQEVVEFAPDLEPVPASAPAPVPAPVTVPAHDPEPVSEPEPEPERAPVPFEMLDAPVPEEVLASWFDDDIAPSPRDAWVDDLPERRARRNEQSTWERNRTPVIVGVAAGALVAVFALGSLLGGAEGGAVTTLSDDAADGETTVEGFRVPFVREAGVESCTAGADVNQYEIRFRLSGARDVVVAGTPFPDATGDQVHVIGHQGRPKTYLDHITIEDAAGTPFRLELLPPVYLTSC